MDDETKKKNILDLQFQKYLIIASTSVIIAFTYVIGASIAIISRQIKLNDFYNMGAIFIISIGVLGICFIIFSNARFHLKNILSTVKSL